MESEKWGICSSWQNYTHWSCCAKGLAHILISDKESVNRLVMCRGHGIWEMSPLKKGRFPRPLE